MGEKDPKYKSGRRLEVGESRGAKEGSDLVSADHAMRSDR